jgi:hypothetical protein
MPRLSNVTLKAMALTGSPANRRPIHAMKSAPKKEEPMPKGSAADLDEALQEPSADVLKALSEVKLSKAAGESDAAAAEAVGRLLAVHKGLTLEDVLAVAKAAGMAPVAKAEDDDEDDDDEDEDNTTDAQNKDGKFKKGNPFAQKMKKSADPKLEDVIKSGASVEVAKAVESIRKSYEARIAKAEAMLHEERDHRLTGLIKSEMTSTFKNLGVDHDKLTSIVKSARSSGKANEAADLLAILKAADAQLGLAAKSGGSAFQNVGKTTQFAGGGSSSTSAIAQIHAHVDGIVQKGEVKKSRPQLMDEFLMTPQGMELWAQHNEEMGA